jgi:hypothetical protein
MDRTPETRPVSVRESVDRVLASGTRCASCFVQVLRDEGVPVPPSVAEVAPALEEGIGGTGHACGAYVAAVLASTIDGGGGADYRVEGTESPRPLNPWLDAFTPLSAEAAMTARRSALGERLAGVARERYGGLDCAHISGAEWPAVGAGPLRLYYATGGAERCSAFIADTVEAYLDTHGGPRMK